MNGDNMNQYETYNEDNELIIDGEKYYKISNKYYYKPNDFLAPIIKRIRENSNEIKKLLQTTPAFIEVVKSAVPIEHLKPILSNDQLIDLANGKIEFMGSLSGDLKTVLVDTKTKKIVSILDMEKVKITPELNTAIVNLSTQMQMAQIAQEIQYVQLAVEEVRKGQENDRLAIAYSCKQKLFQAMAIGNPSIKQLALMNLTASAEDSRNQLILSQIENIKKLKNEPEDFWGKLTRGNEKDTDTRINELRESMNALNMVSLTEALAYQELGEQKAANLSLNYYGDFLKKEYLSNIDFLERLDSLNPSPKRYWSTKLPDIYKNVKLLNSDIKKVYLEE